MCIQNKEAGNNSFLPFHTNCVPAYTIPVYETNNMPEMGSRRSNLWDLHKELNIYIKVPNLGTTNPSLCKYFQDASFLPLTSAEEYSESIAEVQQYTEAQRAMFVSPVHNITCLKNQANNQEADQIWTHSFRCITKACLELTC